MRFNLTTNFFINIVKMYENDIGKCASINPLYPKLEIGIRGCTATYIYKVIIYLVTIMIWNKSAESY